jgi:Flp pilus assembly protein TadG
MILRRLSSAFGGLGKSSRGTVALMMAMLAAPMLGAVALGADASVWLLEQHRLQIAADAAAYAAALQLSNTAMQTGAPASYVTLATNEANAASGGGSLVGTMATPVVSVAADYSTVTVTLSSVASTYFVQMVNKAGVTLQATATAGLIPGSPCVLALNPTAAPALSVSGVGSVIAVGCGVFSDSTSSSSLSLNTGSIIAKTVGTSGGVALAGLDIITPAPTTGAAAQADPDAGNWTLPSAGACTFTNATYNYYKATPFALVPGTYCGTTTIGGNGSTDTFAPGTYIFTGNVSIQNATVSLGAAVTFIMMGATASTPAGSFTWSNNAAGTLSAPPLSPATAMSGLLFWQACPNTAISGSNVNGAITFNGGSALIASGAIYAPCGSIQLSNAAQVVAAPLSSLSVVASTISVIGAASLQLLLTTGSSGSSQVSLLQ